jgi:hypothetical protein
MILRYVQMIPQDEYSKKSQLAVMNTQVTYKYK